MNASPSSPFEQLVIRVGALAGAVAGTVGFVYVVGGTVMWLRFWRSDVPADQALALVPRTDLLVVGMRVLILPALAAGGLFLLLAKKLNDKPKRRASAVLALSAVVLVFVVPLSFGSYAWPLAAVGLACVWIFVLPRYRDDRSALVWRAAVAAMLAAALVSIARQLDHPVRLASATLTFTDHGAPVTGVLVTANADEVVLGFPAKETLQSYPRDRIQMVGIGPALDRRSPPASLLSKVMSHSAWAATPLELWCGGERYNWDRVGDLCQTQPTVRSHRATYAEHAIRVDVDCPQEAHAGCSGFFTLVSEHDVTVGDQSRAAPLRLGPTVFQVPSDQTSEVTIPITGAERRCLVDQSDEVRLHALLSSDQAAEGMLNGATGQTVTVDFGPRRSTAGCASAPRITDTGDDPSAEGTPTPTPTATPPPSGSPTPTATPETTPTPAPSPTPTALPAAPPNPGDDVILSPDAAAVSGG
jgi:hypothetical protein